MGLTSLAAKDKNKTSTHGETKKKKSIAHRREHKQNKVTCEEYCNSYISHCFCLSLSSPSL